MPREVVIEGQQSAFPSENENKENENVGDNGIRKDANGNEEKLYHNMEELSHAVDNYLKVIIPLLYVVYLRKNLPADWYNY